METRHRLRRKVKTGGFERRKYGGSGRQVIVSSNYGYRIVCTRCAHILDLQAGKNLKAENTYILVALFVLLLVLLILPRLGW
ncbi:MAG TPA: hypothetical protein PKA27_15635 [Fimbriimonadaceae bacterium]|nr:hypothetical protein [Fimbriimonadaceae bacterium]